MLIWTELIEFMGEMQRRLEEKNQPPYMMGKSWRSMPMIELEEELRNQVLQLGYAFRRDDRELIRKKAVDVANYCMMIHDNIGR
jgi:hypothetical protein